MADVGGEEMAHMDDRLVVETEQRRGACHREVPAECTGNPQELEEAQKQLRMPLQGRSVARASASQRDPSPACACLTGLSAGTGV